MLARNPVKPDSGSLSLRILFGVMVGALALVALAMSGLIVFRLVASLQAATEKNLEDAARDVGFKLDREFAAVTNVLTALIISDGAGKRDVEKLYRDAVEVSRRIGLHFVLRHMQANQLVFNTAFPWGTPMRQGVAFKPGETTYDTLLSGKPALSDVFFGALEQRNIVGNCVPIPEAGGVQYALCANWSLDAIAEIVSRLVPEGDGSVGVLDRNGTIVARSKDHGKFAGTPAPSFYLIKPDAPSGLLKGLNPEGVPFVWAFRRMEPAGWTVGVGMPQHVFDEPMLFAFVGMIVIGIIVVFLTVVIAYRASRRVVSSLSELRDAISTVRKQTPESRREPPVYRDMSATLAAASAELLAVEDRREFVVSAAEIGTWQWDVATGHQVWSDRYREIIGASRAVESNRANFLDRVHPADVAAVRQRMDRFISLGEPYDCEYRICRADTGEERWIHARARVDLDGSTGLAQVLGVVIDVTPRKRAELETEESAARLKALVDTVSDGVVLIDARGIVLLFNPACERLFGYRSDEVVGRKVGMLMPPPHRDAHDRYVSDYRQSGIRRIIGIGRELSGRHKDGMHFPLMLSVGEVTRDGEPMFVGIIHDLTAHKRDQRERDDLRRRLMRAQEDERLRLAHELHDETGQELAAVMLDLKRLEPVVGAGGRPLLENLRSQLDGMGKSLHRVARELRPTSIDDVGLAKALADHCADWKERFGIDVDYQCVNVDLDALPGDVRTVLYRICQEALTNVARHAVGATDVGIIVDRADDTLRLTIEDNGCGFDHNTAIPPLTEASDGGLGLAGMRERLRLIGGELEIESSAGVGTTIFARIALATTEAAS